MPLPLVPAKAGTQFFAKHWMPAFAGMSGDRSAAYLIVSVIGMPLASEQSIVPLVCAA
jgi:hypothetical protein